MGEARVSQAVEVVVRVEILTPAYVTHPEEGVRQGVSDILGGWLGRGFGGRPSGYPDIEITGIGVSLPAVRGGAAEGANADA